MGQSLIAVIDEGTKGKTYRAPTQIEIEMTDKVGDLLDFHFLPNETMPDIPDLVSGRGWNVKKWSDLFSPRQLLLMQTLIEELTALKTNLQTTYAHDPKYYEGIYVYLSVLIDRIAITQTSYGRWNINRENLAHPFGRQAIAMIFDYPESNPFCDSTGSALNQLDWIFLYIESESENFNYVDCFNNVSGENTDFCDKQFDAVVTDPPYYDAIAYADLSDFFYVWLKKTAGDVFPNNFRSYLTPKKEECTALKHHHDDSKEKAKAHFENKLLAVLTHEGLQIKRDGIVSIMFAHQSPEAWQTLMYSILNAGLNITSSWPFDSERDARMLSLTSLALQSSVTVSCRMRESLGVGNYKRVEDGIRTRVKETVQTLLGFGFRGADLLTACFGPAVGEFGKYDKVEKSDGTVISVADLLALARDAAFEAVVSDVAADDVTRFYIGWLNLFGFAPADHDDVRLVSQIGLHLDVTEMENDGILTRTPDGKQTVTDFNARAESFPRLGEAEESPLIDKLQKAMWLYEKGGREKLLLFIADFAADSTVSFWRAAIALSEALPPSPDKKTLNGLLQNQDSLLKEIKREEIKAKEGTLFSGI